MNRRQFLIGSAILALAACGKRRNRSQAIPEGSAVLALGDSLTYGYGAAPTAAYPVQLATLTGWKVINGGVSGDTTADALARLPELMRQHPKLVIISIGGNDFLRKLPESTTRANIGKIIQTVQTASIPAVLVAIPHFTVGALFGKLSDHPLYHEIAEQYQIPLLSGAWSEILGDKDLKSDQIHANAEGYRKFAELLKAFLEEQGLV
ncbi:MULTISPECIES: arylesterase [Eikenella]|uniref:arylesterase n=1 Tax=Eikenella TaxID=538 RepID=UPI0008A34455|nr:MULTISPECIES: arylesterase [Eikenella]OFN61993.1 arylesterase [Eikenella sp. HMSC061C02]OWP27247.1 arylesterase [Eikenella corrodens]